MNNTYLQIVTTLVRVAFMWLMGALASHLSPTAYNVANDIITKLGGQDAVILGIAGTLATAGLSVYLKLKSKVHLDTALKLPEGATVADVKKASPPVTDALLNPAPIK